MWIFSSLINSFMSCIIDQCYVCQSPINFTTYIFPYVMSLLTIRLAYDLFHLFPFLLLIMKVKDRPFAEGSRGCHALFVCMLNPLVQENVMLYCPLWWQPLLCSLSLLFFTITSSYNAQFCLTLLEAIFIALLHWWQLTWRILLNP